MKSLLRALALLALVAAPAFRAAAFEGKVSLELKSGPDAAQRIDYSFKGGLVRMDLQGGEGAMAMIVNPPKREMIMLMPEQQMFMVMPLKATSPSAAAKADRPATEPRIEKTGRTEKILGYDCEEWVNTEADQTTEFWVTDKLGVFPGLGGGNPLAGMLGGQPASPPATGWESALRNREGFFPLRVVSRDRRGRELFRLETRAVQPGPLADTLFSPPSGFQKLDLPTPGGFPGIGG